MPHITVNDVRLFYEGTGAGEPLVLVHGGFSDHGNFRAVVAGLAESFRVVTYDRRGHSLSERPARSAPGATRRTISPRSSRHSRSAPRRSSGPRSDRRSPSASPAGAPTSCAR